MQSFLFGYPPFRILSLNLKNLCLNVRKDTGTSKHKEEPGHDCIILILVDPLLLFLMPNPELAT